MPAGGPLVVECGVEHQDSIGFLIGTEPREVGKPTVRTEPIVRVIGPNLKRTGGNDQTLSGKRWETASRRAAVKALTARGVIPKSARGAQPDVMNSAKRCDCGRWDLLFTRSEMSVGVSADRADVCSVAIPTSLSLPAV